MSYLLLALGYVLCVLADAVAALGFEALADRLFVKACRCSDMLRASSC